MRTEGTATAVGTMGSSNLIQQERKQHDPLYTVSFQLNKDVKMKIRTNNALIKATDKLNRRK